MKSLPLPGQRAIKIRNSHEIVVIFCDEWHVGMVNLETRENEVYSHDDFRQLFTLVD